MFSVIKRRSIGVQEGAVAYFFAPALGVIILLWMPTPPPAIQKLLGVNLTAGTFAQDVNLGHRLLAECADQQKPLTLYSLAAGRDGVAISVQQYLRGILDEPGYSFNGIASIDWRRAPGVRLDELVSSDLVLCARWIPDQTEKSFLVSVVKERRRNWYRMKATDSSYEFSLYRDACPRTYFEEVDAVVHCLNTMTNADGLQRIVDRDKLAAALARWAGNVRWLTAFPEHNKSFLEKHSEDSM